MAVPLLAWGLAGLVGLGSITLYLAAFFFPEVQRRHDFFWSGVGCFYALNLWLDAWQLTPSELIGHGASISLMGWLGWQTLTLRRKRTPVAQQTPYTADSWPTFRREMTALALDALRQTPLGRWLPQPAPTPASVSGIRVSALKDVGYEFVDSVESPEEPPTAKPFVSPESTATPAPVAPVTLPPVTAVPVASSPASPGKRPAAAKPQPAPKPQPASKGITFSQRVQGLTTWVQDVVRAKTAPKPKKPVIEIPPRPSSLAKRPVERSVDSTAPAQVASAAPSTQPAPEPSPSTNEEKAPVPPTPATAQRPIKDDPLPSDTPETSNWDSDDEDWI